jgi:LemA protein
MMFISALVLAVLLTAGFVLTYNRFVKSGNLKAEAWSGIDVQLKRRYDLIPNLVATVKGYMQYEQDLLTRVTELRSLSMRAEDIGEKGRWEAGLAVAIRHLFAVAEAYPDLKSNGNFLELQRSLVEIEDHIQLARRYYNGTVRDYNILVESFPSNLVALLINRSKAAYFQVDDSTERAAPTVTV